MSRSRRRAAPAKNQRLARLDANGNLDSLIARHAAANNLPEDLLRRVIKRESGGNPRVIYKGNYGLMQIKLATARAMGYRGTAAGLLDADTNMTYAVKYLAGAYHVAGGNTNRAVHYYAAGYYYAAKRKGYTARSQETASAAFASATDSGDKQLIVARNEGDGRLILPRIVLARASTIDDRAARAAALGRRYPGADRWRRSEFLVAEDRLEKIELRMTDPVWPAPWRGARAARP